MTYPSVTALTNAPARISSPETFVTDVALFLNTISPFRAQTNALSAYVNAQIPNKYNFGGIVEVNPTFPSIQQYLGSISVPDGTVTGSINYTSDIDSFYLALKNYSLQLNNVGVWVDTTVARQGVVLFDIDKPMVSGITAPQSNTQIREDFNNSADAFTNTGIDNINSMYQSIWQMYMNCFSPDNYGSIADTTITEYVDAGSITDTSYSN